MAKEKATKEPEVKTEKQAEEKPVDKTRYFRNRRFAKESINYDTVETNGREVFLKETFVGFKRRVLGEEENFGYLATSNPAVIKTCLATSHIDEISKSDFEEETDVKNPKIRQF